MNGLCDVFGKETAAGRSLFKIYNGNQKPVVSKVKIVSKSNTSNRNSVENEKESMIPKSQTKINVPIVGNNNSRTSNNNSSRNNNVNGSGKKMQKSIENEIRKQEVEEKGQVTVLKTKNLSKEKEKLQDLFGNHGIVVNKPNIAVNDNDDNDDDDDDEISVLKKRFKEIEREISERHDFLTTVSKYDKDSNYRLQINSEISKLIIELENIQAKLKKIET